MVDHPRAAGLPDSPSGDSPVSSSASSSSPELEDPITLEKTRSRRSHSRARTVDSDPLSPLEEALASPDQETRFERLARQISAGTSSSHHDHHQQQAPLSRVQTGTTSIASRPPDFEVVFSSDDPDAPANPKSWPLWQRAWIIFCVSFSTWVVVLYSTSYTASIPGLMLEYDVSNQSIVTLGVTTYLLGLAVGSLVVAPMSELYGRRPVYLICLACFTILVLPTALATSLAEILVVRFFG
jgi:hypothetical protein